MKYLATRISSFLRPSVTSRYYCKVSKAMAEEQNYFTLQEMVRVLEEFAPLSLAESWDNVGLLIEPTKPRVIKSALLVNDLTEKVLENAIKSSIELIISYHPPIFAPMKRISQSNWKDRIVAKCLENHIAVYSPHTAWDAIDGGINDWLCSVITGKNAKCIAYPVSPNLNHPNMGAGRIIELVQPRDLQSIIETIKTESKLKNVQIAIGSNQNMSSEIKKVALCAGSGASLLKGVSADLYVTGEMSHHDVLDAVHRNIITALNKSWHPDHFVCLKCDKPISGSTFNERDGSPCCSDCFLQYFSEICASCKKPIKGRNDGPYNNYRPVSAAQQHYRPQPDREQGLLSSISSGFNSLVSNIFG